MADDKTSESSPMPDAGSADRPTRVCRKCSTQSQTAGDFCPHCGARFVRRRRFSRRATLVGASIVVVVLAAAGVAGYLVKHHHDQQVAAARHRRQVAAQQAHAREVAAERAAQAAAAHRAAVRAARERLERSIRHSLIHSLQASITKDAKKDVSDGLLDGPILRTVCQPVGGGNLDDLADHTGNWSCLAVTNDNTDGTSSGYGFSATVNYDTAAYTWHLGN